MSDFLAVNGARLAYERRGQGAPLILLHGFSFGLHAWDPQMDAFAARHDVIRYDLRGFGASSLPEGPYSHTDDLLALMDALNVERAALLGLSLGANVALDALVHHPERVRATVLASPGLPGIAYPGEHPSDLAKRLTRSEGLAAGKEAWFDHDIFRVAHRVPEAKAALRALTDAYSGWHWLNDNPVLPMKGLREGLSGVTRPVLIVSGAEDVAYFRETAEILAAGIPGARRVTLQDGGHVMNMEHPAAFNAAVLDFLKGIG